MRSFKGFKRLTRTFHNFRVSLFLFFFDPFDLPFLLFCLFSWIASVLCLEVMLCSCGNLYLFLHPIESQHWLIIWAHSNIALVANWTNQSPTGNVSMVKIAYSSHLTSFMNTLSLIPSFLFFFGTVSLNPFHELFFHSPLLLNLMLLWQVPFYLFPLLLTSFSTLSLSIQLTRFIAALSFLSQTTWASVLRSKGLLVTTSAMWISWRTIGWIRQKRTKSSSLSPWKRRESAFALTRVPFRPHFQFS